MFASGLTGMQAAKAAQAAKVRVVVPPVKAAKAALPGPAAVVLGLIIELRTSRRRTRGITNCMIRLPALILLALIVLTLIVLLIVQAQTCTTEPAFLCVI